MFSAYDGQIQSMNLRGKKAKPKEAKLKGEYDDHGSS
jgi:hypothetical protein